ncbi:MAG TPA: SRPBCC family protein [Rhodoblastus sp.]|nr:SRPBCC family protein [Rhodoblastus sp.]
MRRRFEVTFPHYRAEDLFAVVDDVESYPVFLPFCRRARILERVGALRRVENVFALGPWRAAFVSEAHADPPRELVIVSRDGPLRNLRLHWRFTPWGDGCRLACDLNVEFASKLLNAAAPLAAGEFEARVTSAFRRRAAQVIGGTQAT